MTARSIAAFLVGTCKVAFEKSTTTKEEDVYPSFQGPFSSRKTAVPYHVAVAKNPSIVGRGDHLDRVVHGRIFIGSAKNTIYP